MRDVARRVALNGCVVGVGNKEADLLGTIWGLQ